MSLAVRAREPCVPRVPSRPINEGAVMKYWRKFMLMALLLIPVVGMSTGCEVDADADDDGAKLEIDTD